MNRFALRFRIKRSLSTLIPYPRLRSKHSSTSKNKEDTGQNRQSMSYYSDFFTKFRSILANILFITLLIIISMFLIHRGTSSQIVIEPIKGSELIFKSGISGDTASRHLWDSMEKIKEEAITSKSKLKLIPEARIADAKIPEIGLQVGDVVHIFKQIFGLYETRISGEFFCYKLKCSRDNAILRIRITGKNTTIHDYAISGDRPIDHYYYFASLEIFRKLDPILLASYYYKKEEFENSKLVLNEIISGNKKDIEWAYNMLGLISMNSGQTEKAIKLFEYSTYLNPEFVSPYINWGNALASKAKRLADKKFYQDSIIQYNRSLLYNSENYIAYFAIGNSLYSMGEYREASMRYSQAHNLNPNDSSVLHNWGKALQKNGEIELAIQKFIEAIVIDFNYSSAHRHLAEIYENEGRHREAIFHYRQLVEANSDDRHARQRLDAISRMPDSSSVPR